ncbi:Apolipoprotein N-acyltransferase [Moraxella lacunata]|uniref:Apolipoprotein N-acyltransferase n=1 Tax=Moraxella lacunata TaxID=477 RepID=A0A378TTS8_MORLA|nr:apolipoprotein N-acyltransferase [Moraxella lacunata]STZ64239.1 Apolipoprotein N-acyltransferase [Moraxella lacunata]
MTYQSNPVTTPTVGIAKRATRQKIATKKRLPLIIPILLCLGAGAMFSLSLAPYKLWTIAILSPMVLYACLVGEDRAGRAFWIGQAYGFGLWAVGAFWLYTSIHEYGNIPTWLALIMIAVMAFIMGLFHAVMAWAFVRFVGRQPLAFASLWVVQEWTKTWLLTGFPWLFVGYAFTDVAWISSLAPMFGVLAISFVAVLFGASVIEVFRQKLGFLLISAFLVLFAMMMWVISPKWTTPTGEKLSMSLIQGNIPQDLKWLTEYRYETLRIYAELSASEWGQDVVVWPEASIPMFQDEAWEFINEVHTHARMQGATWVMGIPYKDMENFNPATREYPHLYNSVLALGEDSGGLYKKQNLVPFGEYIPFEGMLNILPDLAGMQDVVSFSRGDDNQKPLLVKNQPMGSAVCYEVAYPDTTRKNAKETQFLLTVSNDAWFGTSAGPLQHLQMVQMRSMETGRWFVRATNTGVTAFIDDKGRIVSQATPFVPTVLRGEVPMMTGVTPFMRWGSYPILLLAFILVGLSFIVKRQSRYDASHELYYQGEGVRD